MTPPRTPTPPCGICSKHGCADADHQRSNSAYGTSYVVAYAQLVGAVESFLIELRTLEDRQKRSSRVAREVREKMRGDAIAAMRKRVSHLAGYTV